MAGDGLTRISGHDLEDGRVPAPPRGTYVYIYDDPPEPGADALCDEGIFQAIHGDVVFYTAISGENATVRASQHTFAFKR